MKYIKLFESFEEGELDKLSIMELLSTKDWNNNEDKYKIMKYVYNNRKNDIIGKAVYIKFLGYAELHTTLEICIDIRLNSWDKRWPPHLMILSYDNSLSSNENIIDIKDLSELNTKELVDLIKRYPDYFDDKKEYEDLVDAVKIGMI